MKNTPPSSDKSSFDNLSLIAALSEFQTEMTRLPPFLRTLLVADGTVTRSLEAYFWEPIDIIQIELGENNCEEAVDALNLAAGSKALRRKVEMRGRNSGQLYSRADSIIKSDEIPQHWREELISGRLGIGTLISDSGMESYREIMHYDLAHEKRITGEVSRSYRIYLKKKPVFLINEYFPVSSYR